MASVIKTGLDATSFFSMCHREDDITKQVCPLMQHQSRTSNKPSGPLLPQRACSRFSCTGRLSSCAQHNMQTCVTAHLAQHTCLWHRQTCALCTGRLLLPLLLSLQARFTPSLHACCFCQAVTTRLHIPLGIFPSSAGIAHPRDHASEIQSVKKTSLVRRCPAVLLRCFIAKRTPRRRRARQSSYSMACFAPTA